MSIKRIVLSTGEPAGIGPDLAIMLAQQNLDSEVITLACPELIKQRAASLGLAIKLTEFKPNAKAQANCAGELKLLAIPCQATVTAGELNSANSRYVLQLLDTAIQGCQQGLFHAMVTAPVQKSVINEAGIPFTGHTEYLAEKTNTPQVVMMLATTELRVALATTHLPLRDVADAITSKLLSDVCHILHKDLQTFWGLEKPRILVAGLNPHAGEGGHLGREEIEIISPALENLKQQGLTLIGPLPADTLFTHKHLQNADAVLAMYHDQGLPVLKYQGFGRAANITLGLPIIRTSVDHGTALDLAGTGKIDMGSLQTALAIAEQMAENHVR